MPNSHDSAPIHSGVVHDTLADGASVEAIVAAYQSGDMERVIALGTQAGESADEHVTLLLGLAQQATGQPAQAVAAFQQLTRQRPDVSAYWNNLGVVCRQLGDLAASEQALLTARSMQPSDADVHYNLGLLYLQQRRWPLARDALMDAVQLAPSLIEARLQAAHACYVCGDTLGQQAMLDDAAHWPPQSAEQALTLALMLSVQGNTQAAFDTLARAQLPASPDAQSMRLRIIARRCALLERSNQLHDARKVIEQLPLKALDALPPSAAATCAEGWSAHATLRLRERDYAGAAALYRRVQALDLESETRAGAAFGLAAACDKSGDYVQAWQALQTAHAAQLQTAGEVVPELLAADSQPLRLNGHAVGHAAYAPWKALPAPAAADSPVFVLGFPRSGTTLLEQMLDAHPHFRSMDERAFIHELTERMGAVGQRYPGDLANLTSAEVGQLRATYFQLVQQAMPDRGQRRLVDKNPLNMLCLPMIMRLFPNARIIVCLRHPCDVLLSCYMQSFRSPAFMVLCSSLERLARGYVHALEQWFADVQRLAPCVLEWRYESVVTRFDDEVTRLGEFLQVTDAAPMAHFAAHAHSKGFISTPSYAQVTGAVTSGAVGRWQSYRDHFEPVLPILQPWIERLGYAL